MKTRDERRAESLMRALKFAERWMTAAYNGCVTDGTTTSLPRGCYSHIRQIRATIRRNEVGYPKVEPVLDEGVLALLRR